MSPQRVTSADVARLAGVSRTTVSYVLNGRADDIPQGTRDRVHAAAATLEYVPSASARALRRGTTDLVVLVQPRWTMGYTVGQVFARLAERVSDLGLVLVTTQADLTDERVWAATAPFAVLTWDTPPPDVVERLRRSGCRHILSLEEHSAPMTTVAKATGRLAAEHLVRTGRTRLGFAGATDPTVDWYSASRRDGVLEAATTADLPAVVVADVGTNPELAMEAVRRWREAGVTGVVAYNDDVALGVLAAARRLGLSAPADLAVVGIDNTPAGQCSNPALTSVDLVPEAAADLYAAMLSAAMGSTDVEFVDPRTKASLVVRESA